MSGMANSPTTARRLYWESTIHNQNNDTHKNVSSSESYYTAAAASVPLATTKVRAPSPAAEAMFGSDYYYSTANHYGLRYNKSNAPPSTESPNRSPVRPRSGGGGSGGKKGAEGPLGSSLRTSTAVPTYQSNANHLTLLTSSTASSSLRASPPSPLPSPRPYSNSSVSAAHQQRREAYPNTTTATPTTTSSEALENEVDALLKRVKYSMANTTLTLDHSSNHRDQYRNITGDSHTTRRNETSVAGKSDAADDDDSNWFTRPPPYASSSSSLSRGASRERDAAREGGTNFNGRDVNIVNAQQRRDVSPPRSPLPPPTTTLSSSGLNSDNPYTMMRSGKAQYSSSYGRDLEGGVLQQWSATARGEDSSRIVPSYAFPPPTLTTATAVGGGGVGAALSPPPLMRKHTIVGGDGDDALIASQNQNSGMYPSQQASSGSNTNINNTSNDRDQSYAFEHRLARLAQSQTADNAQTLASLARQRERRRGDNGGGEDDKAGGYAKDAAEAKSRSFLHEDASIPNVLSTNTSSTIGVKGEGGNEKATTSAKPPPALSVSALHHQSVSNTTFTAASSSLDGKNPPFASRSPPDDGEAHLPPASPIYNTTAINDDATNLSYQLHHPLIPSPTMSRGGGRRVENGVSGGGDGLTAVTSDFSVACEDLLTSSAITVVALKEANAKAMEEIAALKSRVRSLEKDVEDRDDEKAMLKRYHAKDLATLEETRAANLTIAKEARASAQLLQLYRREYQRMADQVRLLMSAGVGEVLRAAAADENDGEEGGGVGHGGTQLFPLPINARHTDTSATPSSKQRNNKRRLSSELSFTRLVATSPQAKLYNHNHSHHHHHTINISNQSQHYTAAASPTSHHHGNDANANNEDHQQRRRLLMMSASSPSSATTSTPSFASQQRFAATASSPSAIDAYNKSVIANNNNTNTTSSFFVIPANTPRLARAPQPSPPAADTTTTRGGRGGSAFDINTNNGLSTQSLVNLLRDVDLSEEEDDEADSIAPAADEGGWQRRRGEEDALVRVTRNLLKKTRHSTCQSILDHYQQYVKETEDAAAIASRAILVSTEETFRNLFLKLSKFQLKLESLGAKGVAAATENAKQRCVIRDLEGQLGDKRAQEAFLMQCQDATAALRQLLREGAEDILRKITETKLLQPQFITAVEKTVARAVKHTEGLLLLSSSSASASPSQSLSGAIASASSSPPMLVAGGGNASSPSLSALQQYEQLQRQERDAEEQNQQQRQRGNLNSMLGSLASPSVGVGSGGVGGGTNTALFSNMSNFGSSAGMSPTTAAAVAGSLAAGSPFLSQQLTHKTAEALVGQLRNLCTLLQNNYAQQETIVDRYSSIVKDWEDRIISRLVLEVQSQARNVRGGNNNKEEARGGGRVERGNNTNSNGSRGTAAEGGGGGGRGEAVVSPSRPYPSPVASSNYSVIASNTPSTMTMLGSTPLSPSSFSAAAGLVRHRGGDDEREGQRPTRAPSPASGRW